VLRLTLLHGMDEADAKDAVLQAFEDKDIKINMRTLERALVEWRSHFTRQNLVDYESNLKRLELLPT
jgi:hypothetical protein